MTNAVVVDAVRTPVGKRGGSLAGIHPVDLSGLVLRALAERSSLDPREIDDVVWGCVTMTGEQAGNIGRYAVLAADWPEEIPGTTVDRQCGSSQQAAEFAAAGVMAGHYDVVVAGGVESMSRVTMGATLVQGPGLPYGPRVAARYGQDDFNQGVSAEIIAERWGLDRTALDSFALESHARAAAAADAGLFADQIVPVTVTDPDGTDRQFAADEGIRRGGTLETLAKLRPAFREDGLITAGNSSQISDGAAALLIMSEEKARSLGLRPMARFHTAALAAVDPVTMLSAPIPATQKALKRSGLGIADIGVFEVNEAFASVPLAWQAETDADPKRVNPNGGSIALGHPLGGSGARIMTDMLHHMRREGIRYGLQTMCEGGGVANATVLELLDR
ncbi:thiolase family protein [Streptomyces sp. NPDC101225]|uniref:thiolase family protein n=1 Tax=Streptomyces sp. NPDC101225 TaxID=3366135 RepID=UPI0037FC0963